jgi:transcriptional regulator with GAF, ATPase, and Fis domain
MRGVDSEAIPKFPESGHLARTFVDLTQSLSSGQDSYEVLSMLSNRCVELLPVAASGILVLDQLGVLQVVAASSPSAHLLDLFQIQNEQGPCFECYHTGEAITDLDGEDAIRWPRYRSLARSRGFKATYALPLRSRSAVIGALNLFAKENLTVQRLLVAQTLADAATLSLLQLDPVGNQEILARKVLSTIDQRDAIEEAKGIVSQRYSITADVALMRIKRASFDANKSIVEVARAIVSRDDSNSIISKLLEN